MENQQVIVEAQNETCSSFQLIKEPVISIQTFYEASFITFLDEFMPDYVIFVEPNMSFVRQLEVICF